MEFDLKKILFVIVFGIMALIASQINFSQVLGTQNQFFTVFQFFGPIAGAFLGPVFGGAAILLSNIFNDFIFSGKELNLINIARLLPMVFAAAYFATSKKRDWTLIVPLVAIAAFLLHPIGQQVWYFALFWTIPIIAKLISPTRLFVKSLGATFTAHAVGGALWIYVFQTTPEYWIALIPIVIFERFLFAIGISASYIVFNTLLSRVETMLPQGIISIDKKYDLVKMFASRN